MDMELIYEKFVKKLKNEIPTFPEPNAFGNYPLREACDALGIRAANYVSRSIPKCAIFDNCVNAKGVMVLARLSSFQKTVNLAGRICMALLVEEAFPSPKQPTDRTEELCHAIQEVLDNFKNREAAPYDMFIG